MSCRGFPPVFVLSAQTLEESFDAGAAAEGAMPATHEGAVHARQEGTIQLEAACYMVVPHLQILKIG